MILDQINLNNLRLFEVVFRTGSMTRAAQELYLTQSGISQHIKALEDTLGLKLFDRVKQKLVPTSEGKTLYTQVLSHLNSLEKTLAEITAKDVGLKGEVNLATPVVFGLIKVLPCLAELGRGNSGLSFGVRFELAQNVSDLLMAGELDFAFVDDLPVDSRITREIVFEESLYLVCSQSYFDKISEKTPFSLSRSFFENAHFICYGPGQMLVRRWLDYYLSRKRSFQLNVAATVADALGVSQFICGGLGFGVLPSLQVEELKRRGEKIHIVDTKDETLKNQISLAMVTDKTQSRAAEKTLEAIRKGL